MALERALDRTAHGSELRKCPTETQTLLRQRYPPITLPFVLGEVRRQHPQALSLTDSDKRGVNSKRETQAEVWAQPDTTS